MTPLASSKVNVRGFTPNALECSVGSVSFSTTRATTPRRRGKAPRRARSVRPLRSGYSTSETHHARDVMLSRHDSQDACGIAERPQAQRLRSAARWLRKGGGGRMGAGGGMVRSSQRDARSSSLQRMVRRFRVLGFDRHHWMSLVRPPLRVTLATRLVSFTASGTLQLLLSSPSSVTTSVELFGEVT